MTALSALRARVQEENPGYELELSPKLTVTLRAPALLDDVELNQLRASHKNIEKLSAQEETDPVELRKEIVDLLAGVSTEKAKTASALDREPISVISLLLEEYFKVVGDSDPKSGDSAKDSGETPVGADS